MNNKWLLGLSLVIASTAFAAKPVDLRHQNGLILNSFKTNKISVKEISRSVDFNKTLHIRIQEMYNGYPIWGADAVMHIPHDNKVRQSFNGIFYQELDPDLVDTPLYVFRPDQAQKALRNAIDVYRSKTGEKLDVEDAHSNLMVYIDKNSKAHYAFKVSFKVIPVNPNAMPANPIFIMDAASLEVYQEWDNIQTAESFGGGLGGNIKSGKIYYDGLQAPAHLQELKITRKDRMQICLLQNLQMTIKYFKTGGVMGYRCMRVNHNHNDIYWNDNTDAANGGFSPSNDVLYGGQVVSDLYKKWYGVPVLANGGNPMMLNMMVHRSMANAFWDGSKVIFGDGNETYFPFTTLDIVAHEISHGFTEQHSNLIYTGQSGAINESYSDMAGQTAMFYVKHYNNWQIGSDVLKNSNKPIRYLDEPTRDGRSIDNAKNYTDKLNVHRGSGVFNKAFYLLATTPSWNTKKAFDVMIDANEHYWTSSSNFQQAACGVVSAAKDLSYEVADVASAFNKVGIDTSTC